MCGPYKLQFFFDTEYLIESLQQIITSLLYKIIEDGHDQMLWNQFTHLI